MVLFVWYFESICSVRLGDSCFTLVADSCLFYLVRYMFFNGLLFMYLDSTVVSLGESVLAWICLERGNFASYDWLCTQTVVPEQVSEME
jgi:hypothetical protein